VPRSHTSPTTTDLLLQGPPQFNPLLFVLQGVSFQNPGASSVLTLTSTGRVEAYENAASVVAGRFIEVLNFNGVNNVSFAGQTIFGTFYGAFLDLSDLTASTDAAFGLFNYSGGNTAFLGNPAFARSLTQFDGVLILNNVVAAGTGIQTEIDSASAGEARTVIGANGDVQVSGGAGSVGALSLAGSASSTASLLLSAGGTVSVVAARAQGIGAQVNAGTGDAMLESFGDVTVTGASGQYAQYGAFAYSAGGNASVSIAGGVDLLPGTATAPSAPPDSVAVQAFTDAAAGSAVVSLASTARIIAAGTAVRGINAGAAGSGPASVLAAAGSTVDVDGVDTIGVRAESGTGDVTIQTSDVLLEGLRSVAILGTAPGGSVTIDTTAALTETRGRETIGVRASAMDNLTLRLGDIFARGATSDGVFAADEALGVYATVLGPGVLSVDSTAGTVATRGSDSRGMVLAFANGSANILTGDIDVWGDRAIGLELFANAGSATVDTRQGLISILGDESTGIFLDADQANFAFELGSLSTDGSRSDAVWLTSVSGNITVTANAAIATLQNEAAGVVAKSTGAGNVGLSFLANVTAPGELSPAVVASSATGNVAISVGAGAAILGGWELAPGVAGAHSGTGGVGIWFGAGGGAAVTNQGSIGAWSDRALMSSATSAGLVLQNSGNITGFWSLTSAADSVVNSGVVVSRDFSDSDGDAIRDTKRVATVDFGAGDDVFRNEVGGVLRLGVSTAATTVVTGQYLPDLMPVESFATAMAGVEQAHLIRLERFENRGTITLRDMDAGGAAPVAGDVLLMTSGTVSAAGVLTAGATPMVFVADGGALALDTELNAGGATSHSDMLVVDSVQLGPNGPTSLFISNAGGLGLATQGSGIKLIDVLGGGTLSAAASFRLGGPVVAGAFTYNLFRSGTVGDDGDWYLRTAPVVTPPPPPVTPPPVPPPPPPVPPPPPPPTYRPEAALFAAMPEFMRIMDAAVPGSRQARLGDEAGGLSVTRRGRVWARYVRQDIDAAQQGTVAPSAFGDASGFQFGVELFGGQDEEAAQIGLYGGRITGEATISGFANGVQNTPVGSLEPEVTYAGVYVSRSRGRGFYFDAVLQYGYYGGRALTFADGEVADIRGTGGYASLETGYGFSVVPHLVIEPQVQLVAQPQRLHDISILNARVTQAPANTLSGRAGLRLKGDFGTPGVRIQPYVSASLWQGLDHQDETGFSGNGAVQTTLETDTRFEALEYTGGLSVGMGTRLMAFAEYSRLDSRGSGGLRRDAKTIAGGLRFAW
jgi:hypothetical protein